MCHGLVGGRGLPEEAREVSYAAPYGPHCTPTREGYAFVGWFEGDDGTGDEVTAETLVSRREAHTLHARWTPGSGLVTIPPGTFLMGSPAEEVGRFNGEDQVAVTLTRGLLLGSAEVTQGEWKALSGGVNPSSMWRCGDSCPVEKVSWWSALGYLNARSVAEGLRPCLVLPASGCTGTWQDGTLACGEELPGVDGGDVHGCVGYRLPTEAEWEYAARAGTTTSTYGGDPVEPHGCLTLSGAGQFPAGTPLAALAWYRCNNSPGGTKAVRGKVANAWGVHDSLGSVWEWTWDRYLERAPGGTNPQHTASGRWRVVRGGYWDSLPPEELRAAGRGANSPSMQSEALGFRVARSLR